MGSDTLLLERCAPACSAAAARGRSWSLRAPRTRRIPRFESPPFFRQGFQRFMKPYKYHQHKCILPIFAKCGHSHKSQFHGNRTNLFENMTKYLHIHEPKRGFSQITMFSANIASVNSPKFTVSSQYCTVLLYFTPTLHTAAETRLN